jgi:hypothetical protein
LKRDWGMAAMHGGGLLYGEPMLLLYVCGGGFRSTRRQSAGVGARERSERVEEGVGR